jgi:hypothetical protein
MMRLYRALLRFYPERFRSVFRDEILATLAQVHAEKADCGRLTRILAFVREMSGLLAGIFVERCRVRRSAIEIPVTASAASLPTPKSIEEEIAEAEQSIQFHLAKTIECIAHHRFEGARFHAREEDEFRQRLRSLQHLSRVKDPDTGVG